MSKQQFQTNTYPIPTTYNGREVKYFDMNVQNIDRVGSTKQMDNHDFPEIPKGVGQSERIGDVIEAIRLDFNYEVFGVAQALSIGYSPGPPPVIVPSTGQTALSRFILLIDKRVRTPDRVIDLNPHDIMTPNANSGNDLNMFAFLNHENIDTFCVIHDKIHKLQPQYAPDLTPEGFDIVFTYTSIECIPSFNTIDLRGLQIYYDDDEDHPWPSINNIKLLVMSDYDDLIAYRFYMRLYYVD